MVSRGSASAPAVHHDLVLIAEDDSIISSKLKTALELKGYEIKLVRYGPDVLEVGPQLKPGLMVLRE